MKNNYTKSYIEPKNKAKKVNKVSFILTIVFIVFWTLTGFISLFNLFYNLNENKNTSYTNVKSVANTNDIYINYEIFTNNTEYSFDIPLSISNASFTRFNYNDSSIDNHYIGVRPFKPFVEGNPYATAYVFRITKGTYIAFNTLASSDLYRFDIYNYQTNVTTTMSYNSLYSIDQTNTFYYDYYNVNNLYIYYINEDIYIYVRTTISNYDSYFSYVTWNQDYLINQYATTILSDKTFQDTYQSGYDIGYYKGVAYDSTHDYDYTFLGLIGSIVDAPLNAVKDMLDFNLLGINLTAFLQGLLTISLIIAVVRLII